MTSNMKKGEERKYKVGMGAAEGTDSETVLLSGCMAS